MLPVIFPPKALPKMLIANSVLPEPISPAIPTTSPRRTFMFMFFKKSLVSSSGSYTFQFLTSKYTSPISLSLCGQRSVISRPTMPLMILSSLVSSTPLTRVSIVAPSRMTVISSATCSISLSLCEIIIEGMPCFFKSTMISRRCAESSSLRAAVGSSSIKSFTSFASAFAISTSCCLPTPMSFIRVFGFSLSPTLARYCEAFEIVCPQSIIPFFACSLPKNIFSAMER